MPQCLRASWKSAFTLAETLIVIGIIGVVAALTLPNLNHATGDKEKVTKVKKIYSALTDAFDRAQVVYGDFDTWFKDCETAECSERFAKRVTEFMKVSKDCGFDEGCFSSAPMLYIDGEVNNENDLETLQGGLFYMIKLSDGTSVAFNPAYVTVDIDGSNKGKNQDGYDRFSFTVDDKGNFVPTTGGSEKTETDDGQNMGLRYTGDLELDYEFGMWVLTNGNLDYLKCPDELNWETQTSCK